MKKRFLSVAAIISLAAPLVHASGSDSFPSSSSGTGEYNLGKQVYSEQLKCKACALDGKVINKDIAKQLVSDKALTEKLSESDRSAVIAYAKKRFRLE